MLDAVALATMPMSKLVPPMSVATTLPRSACSARCSLAAIPETGPGVDGLQGVGRIRAAPCRPSCGSPASASDSRAHAGSARACRSRDTWSVQEAVDDRRRRARVLAFAAGRADARAASGRRRAGAPGTPRGRSPAARSCSWVAFTTAFVRHDHQRLGTVVDQLADAACRTSSSSSGEQHAARG